MVLKLSEQVRRLEDTIESLRAENKRLRDNWNTPDVRDEIIDHQKRDIEKLKKELWARVKQVEDLQSSYKVLQDENKKLKSKLEQTVDEYDEDYKTFNDDLNDDLRNMANWRIDVEDFFNKRMR